MFSKEAMSSPATDKKSQEQGPSEADEREKLTNMMSKNEEVPAEEKNRQVGQTKF